MRVCPQWNPTGYSIANPGEVSCKKLGKPQRMNGIFQVELLRAAKNQIISNQKTQIKDRYSKQE